MNQLVSKSFSFVLIILIVFNHSFASAKTNGESDKIDKLVNSAIKAFDVPGVSIGIIKDGKFTHIKGYGKANIENNDPVNKNTIFKIASNSKAFTSASLALLVEQGKLKWSDKVHQILPDFEMNDPWVTKEFNIRDLLTHRSGLGRGAGDLMLWPEPTKFSRNQLVKNLRHLNSVSSFRDEYAYDNLLYIVAGEVVAKISGMSWESFVKKEIFKPLGMNRCFAGGVDVANVKNIATPHTQIDNKVIVMEANKINNNVNLMAAAGGIKCDMADVLSWVGMQLNRGMMLNDKRFLSKKSILEMWKPVTTLPLSQTSKNYDNTGFRAYSLGWRVSNYHGEHRVSHTGTLSGFMSQIVMFPKRNVGVVLLMNRDSSAARSSLSRGLMNIVLNQFKDRTKKLNKNWVKHYINLSKKKRNKINKVLSVVSELKVPAEQMKFIGEYVDPWFGEISISKIQGKIVWQSKMSPRMKGEVFYHSKNKWWVKWDDRSYKADAWLMFEPVNNELSNERNVNLKMNSIDPSADFSFDFQDLNFIKINRQQNEQKNK